jgi:hypothetical protein
MVEKPPSLLYLLGNIQSGKSEKKPSSLGGAQVGREISAQPPTYLRNIQSGKSKKKSLSLGKVPGWE